MTYADPRDANYIASANKPHAAALAADYAALGAQLERRGIDIDDITRAVGEFQAWRFRPGAWAPAAHASAAFPDRANRATCSRSSRTARVIHRLTGATPTVSLHLPWDDTDDYRRAARARRGARARASTR